MRRNALALGLTFAALITTGLAILGILPHTTGVDGPLPTADYSTANWDADTASDTPSPAELNATPDAGDPTTTWAGGCTPLTLDPATPLSVYRDLLAAGWWAATDGNLYAPGCPSGSGPALDADPAPQLPA